MTRTEPSADLTRRVLRVFSRRAVLGLALVFLSCSEAGPAPLTAGDEQRLAEARLAMSEERFDDVATVLAPLLSRQPPPTAAQFIVGSAAYELRDYQQAVTRLSDAAQRQPELLPFSSGLGFAQYKLGDFAGARETFAAIVAVRTDAYKAHYGLGLVALTEGQLAPARSALERALQLKPDYLKARFAYGRLLHEEGRLAEARSELEAVLQAWPAHDEALYRLGQVLSALGLTAEAEAVMAQRAEVYRVNEAIAGLQLRREGGEDSATLWIQLVVLHLELGDVDGAESALRSGLRRYPGDSGLVALQRSVAAAR
ncbi:MAG: tetratricopeptide repeat protein [Planctomycetota bacterium]